MSVCGAKLCIVGWALASEVLALEGEALATEGECHGSGSNTTRRAEEYRAACHEALRQQKPASAEADVEDARWLFTCARDALVAEDPGPSGERHRDALLLLRRAAELASARAWREAPRHVEEVLPCRRPAIAEWRSFSHVFSKHDLVPGRLCVGGACHHEGGAASTDGDYGAADGGGCGLVVLDGVILEVEAQDLIGHAELALEEGIGREVNLDAAASATLADRKSHVLFLYVLELMRRLVAHAAGIPPAWVQLQSHFMNLVDKFSVDSYGSHCDEHSNPHFHHSAVLWLTENDERSGGGLEFWDAEHRAWRRRLRPAIGRMALFSSGWENVHRISPVKDKQGRRWSLPFFASLVEPPQGEPSVFEQKGCDMLGGPVGAQDGDRWLVLTRCALLA